MKIKILSVFLSAITFLSLFSVGCGKGNETVDSQSDSASSNITESENSAPNNGNSSEEDKFSGIVIDTEDSFDRYTEFSFDFLPMTASDDGLLNYNPDRGYRTEMVLRIDKTREAGKKYDKRTVFADEPEEDARAVIEGLFDQYFTDPIKHDKMFLAYVYFTDYHADDLSGAALRIFEIFFEECRERKVKSMLRICYNWSYAKNYKLSDENKKLLASECADERTILRHIKQMKPLIEEYSDTVHTISNGFIGYVGEWAKSYQYPEVDYPTVMKAIVENLCVPNGLYFSNRDPEYKNELLAREPNYKYKGYISNNNDAMFGEQKNKDWYSGNMQLGTPEWQQVTDEGAYTPQDGEMFTLNALIDTDNGRYYNPRIPTGMHMILECAHHRHTSMSNWHCYAEALSPSHKNYSNNIMQNWQIYERVTPEILKREKIIYDPNWFVDDDGEAVERDPYQFIRDHLGYKIVATSSTVKGVFKPGESIEFEMKLKNYGFAAAFMLESGFAILDENYNVVSTVKAGSPSSWYSHDPEEYTSTKVLEHTMMANLRLPEKSGNYFLAFYLKNTMNDYARLSNKLPFKNGYNILNNFGV